MGEYTDFPGGERFQPWQDHEWPFHCGVPAEYLGEVGVVELVELSGGEIEDYLRQHQVSDDEPPITLEMIPPGAPAEGEAWDSTIHHFRCPACWRDMFLWDAN